MPKGDDVYLDDGLRGWITNTARKEHWRMAAWYSFQDLVQDGYLCYCKCREAYPELSGVKEPTDAQRRWFMSLVQTTYYNYIMTLAGRFARTKEAAVPDVSSEEDHVRGLEQLMPPEPEVATVMVALKNAPAELRDAVDRLLQDGIDGTEYLWTQLYREGNRVRRGRRSRRETSEEYFQRLTGVADLPEKLRAYLLV